MPRVRSVVMGLDRARTEEVRFEGGRSLPRSFGSYGIAPLPGSGTVPERNDARVAARKEGT